MRVFDDSEVDLSLYGGEDPRYIPAYNITDAAHHLRIPTITLRSWIRGRGGQGRKRTEPLILLPDSNLPLLSFINLIEAHILDALRFEHRIPMKNVRNAIAYLQSHYGSQHPLAEYELETNQWDLFIHESGLLINLSKFGQTVMEEVIRAYLRRVEFDHGVIARLYPFIAKDRRQNLEREPKLVLIDPLVNFGQPILADSGIPTVAVANRYKAGESVNRLASDYGCTKAEVEAAIQYEQRIKKAA